MNTLNKCVKLVVNKKCEMKFVLSSCMWEDSGRHSAYEVT